MKSWSGLLNQASVFDGQLRVSVVLCCFLYVDFFQVLISGTVIYPGCGAEGLRQGSGSLGGAHQVEGGVGQEGGRVDVYAKIA